MQRLHHHPPPPTPRCRLCPAISSKSSFFPKTSRFFFAPPPVFPLLRSSLRSSPFPPLHGSSSFPFPSSLPKPFILASAAASGSRPPSKSNHPLHDSGAAISTKVARAILSVAATIGVSVLVAWTASGTAMAAAAVGSSSSQQQQQMMMMMMMNGSNRGKDVVVSAWMGLMAGGLHTLTGPDHLAALAPLSIGCRSRLESIAVGALWGCGHDAGQVLFGLLFLLLKDKLHIHVLRTWGTRVVGITLLTIGLVGLKEAQEAAAAAAAAAPAAPVAYLATGNAPLLFAGSPSAAVNQELAGRGMKNKNLGFATFATGIVHGLQPDALIMILPALALPSKMAGAAFLAMFLLGTVLAMSGYTAMLGTCRHELEKRMPRITEHLSWVSSLVAITVGVAILAGELFGLSIL